MLFSRVDNNNKKRGGPEKLAEKIGTERGIQMGVVICRMSDRFYQDSNEIVLAGWCV